VQSRGAAGGTETLALRSRRKCLQNLKAENMMTVFEGARIRETKHAIKVEQ